MTIDEAIEELKSENGYYANNGMTDVAEFNTKIIRLLEELKELRELKAGHLYAVAFNRGYLKAEKEVREKTIDDFAEIFKSKTSMENMLVDEIAEQLKAGGENG